MATLALSDVRCSRLQLSKIVSFAGMRALAWSGDVLYASRKYELLRTRISPGTKPIHWEPVSELRAEWWRRITACSRLSARLCRDGFHALAIPPSGALVAAVPKAIVTLRPGEQEFRITHHVSRGTRPLHITASPDEGAFWGEYFDNPDREEVHIYGSTDHGMHWDVAYTFPRRTIRHVHNIVYDSWGDCFWVLTGDNGAECKILRASRDFRTVDVVVSGRQQTRSVALVPSRDAIYFSSDTPLEENHVYRLDRRGRITQLAGLSSSSICGCKVGDSIFFSTMVEPSSVNRERTVGLYGSSNGESFERRMEWQKDRWPMGLFQYGNAFFPDGNNGSGILAVSTVAVKGADFATSLWEIR